MFDLFHHKKEERETNHILWALFAILVSTLVGIFIFLLCEWFNISIFGINCACFVAPLICGYIETALAKRFYGATTGAISALILFIVCSIDGFILTDSPWNIFTVAGLGMTLQIAFPVAVNYILFILLGVIVYFIGKIGEYLEKIHHKIVYFFTGKDLGDDVDPVWDYVPVDVNSLGVLLLTSVHLHAHEVSEYLGVVEGRVLVDKPKTTDNISDEKNEYLLRLIQNSENQALVKLAENSKKLDADAIMDINLEIDGLGTEDRSKIIQIMAKGTAVKIRARKKSS